MCRGKGRAKVDFDTRVESSKLRLSHQQNGVWVKIKPGDRRFWSMFPLTSPQWKDPGISHKTVALKRPSAGAWLERMVRWRETWRVSCREILSVLGSADLRVDMAQIGFPSVTCWRDKGMSWNELEQDPRTEARQIGCFFSSSFFLMVFPFLRAPACSVSRASERLRTCSGPQSPRPRTPRIPRKRRSRKRRRRPMAPMAMRRRRRGAKSSPAPEESPGSRSRVFLGFG